MRINFKLFGVLLAAAVLSGCGQPPAQGSAASGIFDAAQTGEHPLGMAPPANYPKDVKLPVDAFVTSVSEGVGAPTAGEVVFSTAHKPPAVAKAYLEALRTAGFDAAQQTADGGVVTVAATRGSRRITVSSALLEGVGSEVTLTYR